MVRMIHDMLEMMLQWYAGHEDDIISFASSASCALAVAAIRDDDTMTLFE